MQGERRFFRVVTRWLANNRTEAMRRNLAFVPEFGRWDDLYTFVGTPLEKDAFAIMLEQVGLDVQCQTPSLLAKWLKSENTSSAESRRLGVKTRVAFGMTPRQYRKTLSILRGRIRIVETLMSENRWDEIEFDKIPSKAGFKYRNAFARRDIIKARYEQFAKDTTTKVNAKTLYPYEIVEKAMDISGFYSYGLTGRDNLEDTERLMVNKYWDNCLDVLKGKPFNGIVMADTSGSMYGTPMNVAISLAMYCAERASGPYHNHFLTFSDTPTLVEVEGADFCEKVKNVAEANWGMSTNIEAALDLILKLALENNLSQDEIPATLAIISDMQFNSCVTTNTRGRNWGAESTVFEAMKKKWADCGYDFPQIVFWNVNAWNGANIPMKSDENVCYVSGFSPVLFEQILECKSAVDLMLEKLNSERYASIH